MLEDGLGLKPRLAVVHHVRPEGEKPEHAQAGLEDDCPVRSDEEREKAGEAEADDAEADAEHKSQMGVVPAEDSLDNADRGEGRIELSLDWAQELLQRIEREAARIELLLGAVLAREDVLLLLPPDPIQLIR